MKYYLDCEFDGLGGDLLSMAIVSEFGRSMYVVMDQAACDPWVQTHVVPLLANAQLNVPYPCIFGADAEQLSTALETYFEGENEIHIVADWPDDINYLCNALVTGPGTMINIPGITFEVVRVNAYPTDLPGAVQHNAWWDAMALRHLMLKGAR